MLIDFFSRLPSVTRGRRVRTRVGLTPLQIEELKRYDEEYFDGETGYGGYRYDGRWRPVAEEMIAHYGLKPGDRVLEVGCAKGYLVYEFFKLGIVDAYGCDISSYAIGQTPEEIRRNFQVCSADDLSAYPDKSFDLVLTIDCLNNLDSEGVDRAILEIARVSRKHAFIRVGSYRSAEELENIRSWGVTSLTFESPEGWLARFNRSGYRGDWYFRFMPVLR